jgi:hypothetical protein
VFALIAVVLAHASSLTLGASAVIEQRGTKLVTTRGALSPQLFVDLVRQPRWLAGIAGEVVALLVMTVGIVVIAHHAPIAVRQQAAAQQAGAAA